jgi:hypothetical protein
MKRIRKFALSLALFLFLVSPVLAQSPVKIYFMGPAGQEKVVSATDPLPVIMVFSSLPLPLGASTEATLQLILNELTDPDSKAYITNWPSTYNVGNWPTSFGAAVSNWPTGFNVNNWPTSFTVHESAFPDTYPVEGGNATAVKVNDDTMPDTWYLDVQAKLFDLKTQLDKLKFATDDLKVVFSNSWPSFFTDRLTYDTQLQQFKFATDDLKVVFSNWPSGFNVDNWPTSQTIDGTVSVTGIVDLAGSDTIFMDSMAVNPYSETTKSLTGVKQLKLKARTGIDVRVAMGTGSSTASTYEVIYAGSEMILKDLNSISIAIAVMGDDATSGDTGILSVIYCK